MEKTLADVCPLAEPHDVVARWISSSPVPDTETIRQYLADAQELLATEFPRLEVEAENSVVYRRRAKIVLCRMVLRALSNPDSVRHVQETTGPFSGGITYGTETLGGLQVTDAERAILAPPKRQTVFTVGPQLELIAPAVNVLNAREDDD